MYAARADDEQHIQRYLSANCFGDYVARAGIDLQTRELLTFAMLVALGGCRRAGAGATSPATSTSATTAPCCSPC